MRQLSSTYTAIGRVRTCSARAIWQTHRWKAPGPGRPEIRTRVEVQVLRVGIGRAEEPEEEERPHIGMEWQVEEGVRHVADPHERVGGEEPTDLLEGSEGEP